MVGNIGRCAAQALVFIAKLSLERAHTGADVVRARHEVQYAIRLASTSVSGSFCSRSSSLKRAKANSVHRRPGQLARTSACLSMCMMIVTMIFWCVVVVCWQTYMLPIPRQTELLHNRGLLRLKRTSPRPHIDCAFDHHYSVHGHKPPPRRGSSFAVIVIVIVIAPSSCISHTAACVLLLLPWPSPGSPPR